MTEFNLYDETNAPEAARSILNTAKGAFGFVPNLLGTLAESPAAAEAYLTLAGIVDKTSLSPAERQIVLLTVSYENTCHYCMAAHSTLAGGAGVDAATLDALRSGAALPDARQDALAQFARTLVQERGYASEADIKAFLDAGFTKANIFDVITATALKTISNYANHVAETPVDEAFEPQSWTRPEAA
ncbi:carboxymuconolactone decarboxylase family protein [Oceanicaulis sp.]|uniref:carboxymuconolactone decarboxylase family protein n=1 Tax=Oceanicaulis sp. TaxID=1924941 RepID=UPI003D29E12E